MGDEYSALKMAWWAMREGWPPPFPKQVQLILSDLCNQDCHFCAYRMSGYTSNELFTAGATLARYGHNNPVRFFPPDRALRLVDEMAEVGVRGVQFTGGGEPTVHRDHFAIFQRTLRRGMQAALVSNGVRWSDGLVDLLGEFAWVRVSIDAGTPETYARIRGSSEETWGRVWRNVEVLAPSRTVLGIGYVVTPDNWDEIGQGVARARESGARYIRMSAAFTPDGAAPYARDYDRLREAIHEARAKYETATFRVHDLFGDRVQDLAEGAPDYPLCAYQHYNTYIGADQNVYRCCVYAYNRRGLVGSIKDVAFGEFWHSEARRADMAALDPHKCERCQFNNKNRAMNYLVGEPPLHVEFP